MKHLWKSTLFTLLFVAPQLLAQYENVPGSKAAIFSFSENSELKLNAAYSLLIDSQGFLWAGTLVGLVRYDGYTFKNYSATVDGLLLEIIEDIKSDDQGRIWGCTRKRLFCFDPGREQVVFLKDSQEEILHIYVDSKGKTWCIYKDLIEYIDHDSLQAVTVPQMSSTYPSLSKFYEQQDGTLWLSQKNKLYFSRDHHSFEAYSFNENIPEDIVAMIQDPADSDQIWCISKDRVFKLILSNGQVETFPAVEETNIVFFDGVIDPTDANRLLLTSLNHGLWDLDVKNQTYHPFNKSGIQYRLRAICPDPQNKNVFWLASFGAGILQIDLKQPFKRVTGIPGPSQGTRQMSKQDSQTLGDIWGILEASDRSLWVASHGSGLLHWRPGDSSFSYLQHEPDNPKSLPANGVYNMVEDSHQKYIWVTTEQNLCRVDIKTLEVERTPLKVSSELRAQSMLSLHSDETGLVVSSFYAVYYLPDYQVESARSFPISKVMAWEGDHKDRLWAGGVEGLFVFSKDRTSYTEVKPGEGAASLPRINDLTGDPRDPSTIWAATEKGLYRLNAERDVFSPVNIRGLSHSTLIVEVAPSGQLWICSISGLHRVDPSTGEMQTFNVEDGLHGGGFTQFSSEVTRDGIFLFGGKEGFTWFDPDDVKPQPVRPGINFTELRLANTLIQPRAIQENSPLEKAIEYTDHMTLSYKEKIFSVKFAGTNFKGANVTQYAFRLDGFDEDWNYRTAQERVATYTNVEHGAYTLQVKAAGRDQQWGSPRSLKLTITTPPWRTPFAYLLYVMALAAVIYAYVRQQNRKLEQERLLVKRLQQVDTLKDAFLANTSHELRTPLNGIVGLTESLIQSRSIQNPADRASLQLIITSGRRLANLVNDILDFSKLKENEIQLSLQNIDLYSLVDVILALSQPLARDKNLELLNRITKGTVVRADENRLEQILYNLIGNGIKFTEKGSVTLSSKVEGDKVLVEVTDTGIGIKEAFQHKIFNAFEQGDGSMTRVHGGTGLGLAITRQLVEIHGGMLTFQSQEGVGSTFSFTLPKGENNEETLSFPSFKEDASYLETNAETELLPLPNSENVHILVVDDEPVNRRVISNHLEPLGYTISEAFNGHVALEMLESGTHYDLVLLDIMMPHISGYEVCRKVRSHSQLHALPIIFLTARNRPDDLVAGFDAGGNDYLVKPIARAELLSRLSMHLQLLETARDLEDKVNLRTQELQEKNNELVRTRDRLIMQEKLALMGTVASGMAHEIKNPLNFVNNLACLSVGVIEEMQEEIRAYKDVFSAEDYEHFCDIAKVLGVNLEKIVTHGARVDQVVEALKGFASERKDTYREVPFNAFLEKAVGLARSRWQEPIENLDIQWELDSRIGQVKVMEGELTGALMHLLNNAHESLKERRLKDEQFAPTIIVGTRILGDSFELFIKDNGVGISEEHLASAFKPFFTTKMTSTHIGLGLTITSDIVVQGHGGDLTLSCEGGMTTARIRLLLSDKKQVE